MATAQLLLKLREKIASLPRGIDRKLLSMAECLIYESRLLIEDALEDSSLFTSSFSRSSWSLSAKATAVLESRHLSEQFELNMQLLGMEAYPEQREFVAYIEDSLQQPLQVLLKRQRVSGRPMPIY